MLEVQCPIQWIHTSRKTKLQMTKHYSIVIKDSNADLQTFSVRRFWPAPARTSHKNRNVRRMHQHTIFCACTRTFFRKKIFKKFFFFNFLNFFRNFFFRIFITWIRNPWHEGVYIPYGKSQLQGFEKIYVGRLFSGYLKWEVLEAWMTFKKAEMAKTLRNVLSMIKTNSLNHNLSYFAI